MGHPERRRQQRLHRETKRSAARHERATRQPSERAIQSALQKIADHDVPGTPPVGALKVLNRIHESERTINDRTVESFSITTGRPRHGALRSDDHIGSYELRLPLVSVDHEAVPGELCPECGGDMVLYQYNAHHFIAGSESVVCPECEEVLYSEDWG